jgi:hypothetical protein
MMQEHTSDHPNHEKEHLTMKANSDIIKKLKNDIIQPTMNSVKNFALRGITPQLDSHLKKEAEQSNQSVNQLILTILEERSGLTKEHRFTHTHSDLDFVMGAWTPQEAREIEEAVAQFDQTEDELWST